MSLLEIIATILTVISVLYATNIKTMQYPVGIVATILFFFVFWEAKLYSSAWLQVYFTVVQFYGWWYWLKGDKGHEPKITTWRWPLLVAFAIIAFNISWGVSDRINAHTDAKMALMDTFIFALSVSAQFLLDRKKLEHWFFWGAVNVISIWVYSSQGLGVTTALYVGLLINVFFGFRKWKKEYDSYTQAV